MAKELNKTPSNKKKSKLTLSDSIPSTHKSKPHFEPPVTSSDISSESSSKKAKQDSLAEKPKNSPSIIKSETRDSPKIPKNINPEQVNLAITTLISHCNKTTKKKLDEGELFADDIGSNDCFINLVISLKRIASREKHKPIKLELSHPLLDPRVSPVCLIVKDTQREYKDLLEEKGISFISKVVDITKLRGKHSSYEARRLLLNSHQLFLADDRITPILPNILGSKFFQSKKLPVPVDLTDLQKIKATLEKAISSTYLRLGAGSCVTVKVGDLTRHNETELRENLNKVLEQLNKKLPKGGWSNIQGLHIKTGTSISLPIWLSELNSDEFGRFNLTTTETEQAAQKQADDQKKMFMKNKHTKKNEQGDVDIADCSFDTEADMSMDDSKPTSKLKRKQEEQVSGEQSSTSAIKKKRKHKDEESSESQSAKLIDSKTLVGEEPVSQVDLSKGKSKKRHSGNESMIAKDKHTEKDTPKSQDPKPLARKKSSITPDETRSENSSTFSASTPKSESDKKSKHYKKEHGASEDNDDDKKKSRGLKPIESTTKLSTETKLNESQKEATKTNQTKEEKKKNKKEEKKQTEETKQEGKNQEEKINENKINQKKKEETNEIDEILNIKNLKKVKKNEKRRKAIERQNMNEKINNNNDNHDDNNNNKNNDTNDLLDKEKKKNKKKKSSISENLKGLNQLKNRTS